MIVDIDKCVITHYPAPVLAHRAEEVPEVNDNICQLAEKMKDVMVETKGVGLAGPQVGLNLRIFVASPDGSKEGAKVYINPKIKTSDSLVAAEEGCLSLPGVYGKVHRHKKCTITATGLDGKEFTEEAEGLLARIFQHEYDHLEGTMVKDRLGTVAKISAKRHLKKMREKYAQDNS